MSDDHPITFVYRHGRTRSREVHHYCAKCYPAIREKLEREERIKNEAIEKEKERRLEEEKKKNKERWIFTSILFLAIFVALLLFFGIVTNNWEAGAIIGVIIGLIIASIPHIKHWLTKDIYP